MIMLDPKQILNHYMFIWLPDCIPKWTWSFCKATTWIIHWYLRYHPNLLSENTDISYFTSTNYRWGIFEAYGIPAAVVYVHWLECEIPRSRDSSHNHFLFHCFFECIVLWKRAYIAVSVTHSRGSRRGHQTNKQQKQDAATALAASLSLPQRHATAALGVPPILSQYDTMRCDTIHHSSWKAILQSKYQTETDSPGCVATRSTASVFLFATATSSRQLPPKRSCSDSTRFVSFRFDSFRLVSFRIVSSSSRISPLVLTHCDKFNSLSRRLLLLPCRALYLPLTLSLTRTEEQEKKITTKARRALRLVLVLVSISISYRLEIASKSLACAAQKCVVTWQTVGRKLIAFGLGFGFCFQRQQRRERADAARQHFVAPATFS